MERTEHQRSGRDLIRDAAWMALGEQGYEAATMRSVARRARVDPRLVRYYFPTKGALMAEGLSAAGARLAARTADRPFDRWALEIWDAEPLAWQALVAGAVSIEPQMRARAAELLRGLGAIGNPGPEGMARLVDFSRILGLWLNLGRSADALPVGIGDVVLDSARPGGGAGGPDQEFR